MNFELQFVGINALLTGQILFFFFLEFIIVAMYNWWITSIIISVKNNPIMLVQALKLGCQG